MGVQKKAKPKVNNNHLYKALTTYLFDKGNDSSTDVFEENKKFFVSSLKYKLFANILNHPSIVKCLNDYLNNLSSNRYIGKWRKKQGVVDQLPKENLVKKVLTTKLSKQNTKNTKYNNLVLFVQHFVTLVVK